MQDVHRSLLDLASAQHGLVTRRHAETVGLSRSGVDRMLRDGMLVPIASGVFRVRGAVQTPAMAMMGATLATNGHLSHTTALHALRLVDTGLKDPLHVTVDVERFRPRVERIEVRMGPHTDVGVRPHRTQSVAKRTVRVDGIPCADAVRTLIDAAPSLSPLALEGAFERARQLGLVSIDSLASRFAEVGGRGRAGSAKVRALLDATAPGVLESQLEVRAWRLLRSARLPMGLPVRQFWVDAGGGVRYRLDFAWPTYRVAFETEGFRWHGTNARWKQDRVRTATLERLGWRIVVATWDDIVLRRAETLDRLLLALDERQAA